MYRLYHALLVVAIACVAMTGSGCDESAVEPADSLVDWLVVYPMIDAGPAWSPDGSTIAYHHFGVVDVDPLDATSRIDEDLAGLWLIDIDGGTDAESALVHEILGGDGNDDVAPRGTRRLEDYLPRRRSLRP